MPSNDLGILITLNTLLTLAGLSLAVAGIWGIMRQNLRSQEIGERVAGGRSYGFGDKAKTNKVSKRPLTQASLRCKRWLNPSSLPRIPTPLQRCWMSHVQALSTMPEPRGKPSALYLASLMGARCRSRYA